MKVNSEEIEDDSNLMAADNLKIVGEFIWN